MTNFSQELERITNDLLDPELKAGALFNTCNAYINLLVKAIAYNEDAKDNAQDINTPSGRAIAPNWAIRCIKDLNRTHAFIRGLNLATQDRLENKSDSPVNLLYAGTGPFAALALPLTTRFTPEQIQFTFLELNKESLDRLRNIIKVFKLDAYVAKLALADASTYTVERPEQIDIVVTETMAAGLKTEPQVAISFALMNQLNKDTVMIPQEINLELCLVDYSKRHDYLMGTSSEADFLTPLGTAFRLNKTTIREHANLFSNEFPDVEFPELTIQIPKGAQRAFDAINLKTEITVYQDIVLKSDSSSITTLLKVVDFETTMIRFSAIRTQYISDHKPGLDCALIP